ncbi:DUF968 domain-containing protein [Halomonas caseinilytica]|uniref:DUF968 domain-containing protein n=1 Tax=Halomonas caseinilytica TaxID=438744 RepID=A0A1M6T8B4_9GAMM|nr:DUF968 domain-containing protein [Halomonas caseinilytica]SHK53126.1 Protein of unknown function [Halomonas caseinilytica]
MKRTPLERKSPLRANAPMNRKREKRQPALTGNRRVKKSGAKSQQRFRSERYLRFVRSLPCCCCGGPADSAHHVIGIWQLGGMALKAPDSFAMPVCDGPGSCHEAIHAHPEALAHQPRWLRHTIALGMQEFDGEIREALVEALAFINKQEAA